MRSDRERCYDLIHGYFDIDVELVWSVAENDLPKLGAQVRAILDQLP